MKRKGRRRQGGGIDAGQSGQAEHGQYRHHRPHRPQPASQPDGGDEERHQQGAERHARDQRTLECTEDPSHDLLRRQALEHGERVDVDQGVSDPDERHHDDGAGERGPDRHQHQWRCPQGHPDAEIEGEALPLRQHKGQAADDAADAGHGVEQFGPGVAEVQHLQGDGHREDHAGTGDDRLGEEEADEEAQVPVPADEPEAGGDLGPHVGVHVVLLRDRRRRRHPQADDQAGGPEKGERVQEEDRLEIGHRQQDGGHGRPGEEADALDGARRGVRGRELGRVPGQHRKKGRLGGPKGRAGDGGHDGEGVHRWSGSRWPPPPLAAPTRRHRSRSAPIITCFFGSRSASELKSGPVVAMAR